MLEEKKNKNIFSRVLETIPLYTTILLIHLSSYDLLIQMCLFKCIFCLSMICSIQKIYACVQKRRLLDNKLFLWFIYFFFSFLFFSVFWYVVLQVYLSEVIAWHIIYKWLSNIWLPFFSHNLLHWFFFAYLNLVNTGKKLNSESFYFLLFVLFTLNNIYCICIEII